MLERIFASGQVVDLIIVLLWIEGAAILWMYRKTGFGLPWQSVVPMMASGTFLLLALRFALTGWSWHWVAVCLGLGGIAHAVDLVMRRCDR